MAEQLPVKISLLNRFFTFMRADGHVDEEQREPEDSLLQTLSFYSALRYQFVIILAIATAIATLGLMGDSAVAIVGAMLIAPLMKPILAFAYGIVTADWRLQLRSLFTLVIGILITLTIAIVVEQVIGLEEVTMEIMARTQPSLIDLGIAIAAGIAASLAAIRRNVTDTLPGVAIAVALLPPLCVSSICFSIGAWSYGGGALLLFGVNLVAIVLSAIVVFRIDGYGSVKHAWLKTLIIVLIGLLLILPLSKTMRQMKIDDLAQEVVEEYLHEKYRRDHVIHPADLSSLTALLYPDHVFVFMEVKAPAEGLNKAQMQEIHQRLTQAVNKPVNLKVQFLLTAEKKIYSHLLADGKQPEYGQDDLVTRR